MKIRTKYSRLNGGAESVVHIITAILCRNLYAALLLGIFSTINGPDYAESPKVPERDSMNPLLKIAYGFTRQIISAAAASEFSVSFCLRKSFAEQIKSIIITARIADIGEFAMSYQHCH